MEEAAETVASRATAQQIAEPPRTQSTIEIVNLVTAIEGGAAPTAAEGGKSGNIATTTQLSESTELQEEVEIVNLVNLLGAAGTAQQSSWIAGPQPTSPTSRKMW